VSRCKFGEEISDNRFVDGRLKKGHVALGLAAGRNENEFSVSDALPCTIDDPKLRRVQFVQGVDIFAANAFEVPGTLPLSSLNDLLTIFLNSTTGSGGILNVINGKGGSSTKANPDTPVTVVSYP
jgi:hypothetical protein